MADYSVNKQYEYTSGMFGGFSGGTAPLNSTVPHPVAISYKNSTTGDTVTNLNAVTLGGVYGLNN